MAKKPKSPDETADAETGAGEAAPAKKKLAGKTLVLFVILPVLLLLVAGGGAAYFLLGSKGGDAHAEAGDHGKKEKKKDKKASGHGGGHGSASGAAGMEVNEGEGVYYVTLPTMLVNFTADDGRAALLKLKVTLEAPNEHVAYAVEPQLPRVMDQFQGFLRELRMEDIAGSAGAERLRLELLRRVNLAIAPEVMNAVLIEEMLVQ